MVSIAAILQGAGLTQGLIGGIVSSVVTARGYKNVLESIDEMKDSWPLGTAEDIKVALTEYVGDVAPDVIAKSAYVDITSDPRLRESQMKAIDKCEMLSEQGMSAQSRADLDSIQDSNSRQARGAREAYEAQQTRRGITGSGMGQAQQMLANQEAASNMHRQGLGLAVADENKRLSALNQMASLSGAVRGQDFGEASAEASAKDNIAMFNSNMRNRAAMQNQSLQQQVNNANANSTNQGAQYNANRSDKLAQNQYQNQLGYQQMWNNARLGLAGAKAKGADAVSKTGYAVADVGNDMMSPLGGAAKTAKST